MLTTLAAGSRLSGSWRRLIGTEKRIHSSQTVIWCRARKSSTATKKSPEQPVVYGYFRIRRRRRKATHVFHAESVHPHIRKPAGNSPGIVPIRSRRRTGRRMKNMRMRDRPTSWAGSIHKYFRSVRPKRPRPGNRSGSRGETSTWDCLPAETMGIASHKVVECPEDCLTVASRVMDLQHERAPLGIRRGPSPQPGFSKKVDRPHRRQAIVPRAFDPGECGRRFSAAIHSSRPAAVRRTVARRRGWRATTISRASAVARRSNCPLKRRRAIMLIGYFDDRP